MVSTSMQWPEGAEFCSAIDTDGDATSASAVEREEEVPEAEEWWLMLLRLPAVVMVVSRSANRLSELQPAPREAGGERGETRGMEDGWNADVSGDARNGGDPSTSSEGDFTMAGSAAHAEAAAATAAAAAEAESEMAELPTMEDGASELW
jgi:hypothetical protein